MLQYHIQTSYYYALVTRLTITLLLKLQFKYFLKDPVKYDVKYQVSHHLVRIVIKLRLVTCRVCFILKYLKNLKADRSFDDNTLLDYYRLVHSRSWCLVYS